MERNEEFLKWLKERGEEGAYLFSNDSELSYEDYKEFCEEMGKKPKKKNSVEYYDFCENERQRQYDDDRDNCRYASALIGRKFLLTGKLGLWWGTPTIKPEVFNSFDDCVDRCISGSDAMTINAHYNTKCITLECSHHDGTNVFDIYIIKEGVDIDKLEEEIETLKFNMGEREFATYAEEITDFLY